VRALGIAILLLVAAGSARAAVPPPRQGVRITIEPTSVRTFYREPGQARRQPLTTETRGLYAAATVRGATWRTHDRCDGTLVTVTEGVVAVRDFRLGRTVLIRAGRSYLARA